MKRIFVGCVVASFTFGSSASSEAIPIVREVPLVSIAQRPVAGWETCGPYVAKSVGSVSGDRPLLVLGAMVGRIEVVTFLDQSRVRVVIDSSRKAAPPTLTPIAVDGENGEFQLFWRIKMNAHDAAVASPCFSTQGSGEI